MKREIHRENRENKERQEHVGPIYPKRINNHMQYAQSPLGKVYNHPLCQHTPLNMHSLMQPIECLKKWHLKIPI